MKKSTGMSWTTILLIIGVDILNACAELSFKKGTMATHIHQVLFSNFSEFALRLISSTSLWTGILCYVVMFLLWITVLSRVDLSVAFLIFSADYLLIPLLSFVFLKENISLLRWVGIAFVLVGICLTSRSALSTRSS